MSNMHELRLQQNNINSTIPSSWSQLGDLGARLSILDVSSNNLVGTLPPQLSNISSPYFAFFSIRNNRY